MGAGIVFTGVCLFTGQSRVGGWSGGGRPPLPKMATAAVGGSFWNAFVFRVNSFTFQTQYDGRMFNLNITCGDNYPEMPPDVRFVSKIAMNCVDKNGRVSILRI